MIIEPLALKHQGELTKRFKEMSLFISEYSFANLYLFRTLHQYAIITWNEKIFIKGLTRDQIPFIMPTQFPFPDYLETLNLLQVKLKIPLLFPIPEEYLPHYNKNTLRAEFNEAESDYLYSNAKLAAYPGRHLSKKRNLSKQFLTIHQGRSTPLTKNNLEEAKTVLDNWTTESGQKKELTDYSSCLEALENFSLLNLEGRVVYADREPAGIIIGEWINNNCFAIHFQKALKAFQGSYQYLLQNTAIFLLNPNSWINLEQDLGLSTLRSAKKSYLPDKIILKLRLFNEGI